jgi:hypothetical protein
MTLEISNIPILNTIIVFSKVGTSNAVYTTNTLRKDINGKSGHLSILWQKR